MTISVGEKFPEFNLKAVDGKKFDDINIDNVFVDVSNESYKGKWMTIFFYPKDFTFVCPLLAICTTSLKTVTASFTLQALTLSFRTGLGESIRTSYAIYRLRCLLM